MFLVCLYSTESVLVTHGKASIITTNASPTYNCALMRRAGRIKFTITSVFKCWNFVSCCVAAGIASVMINVDTGFVGNL